MSPPLTWIKALQNARQNRRIGNTIVDMDRCGSTNEIAMHLARQGAVDGTVVLAREQTQGRGRQGRIWVSFDDSLLCSIIIRPTLRLELAPRITSLTAAALLDTLHGYGIPAEVKWPNDVLLPTQGEHERYPYFGAYRKVCGILVETSSTPPNLDAAVIGIGLNISRPSESNPHLADLPHVGFLSDHREGLDPFSVCNSLFDHLEARLENPRDNTRFALTLNQLRQQSATLGKTVTLNDGGRMIKGTARALNSDGSLQIETEAGELTNVHTGDVGL